MKNCANCLHGKRINGAVRFCELVETAHKNDHTCSCWEEEDLHESSCEEMEREDGIGRRY